MRQVFAAIVVLGVILGGIGAADYVLREQPRFKQLQAQQGQVVIGQPLPIDANPSVEPGPPAGAVSSMPTMGTSSRRAVKKGQSTKKREAINVRDVFASLGLEEQATREISLLQVTSPVGQSVTTSVLLQNADRAALFSWLDSADAKTLFATLKESLQSTFSPDVRDVADQTIVPDGGAPVDVLSFTDPALSSEKIIFARIRTRLYEIHIPDGKEDLATALITALAK